MVYMPLTSNALTTLQTVKDELEITDTSQDATLERLINAASDAIERYCERAFHYEEDIVEKVAGYGTPFIVVSRTPIISISSIKIGDSTLDSSEYELTGGGLIYRLNGTWGWSAQYAEGIVYEQIAGTEEQNIAVTYTGGYVTQNQEDNDPTLTRSLPYDLEEACITAVVALYSRIGERADVKRESLMSASYEYDRATGLPTIVLDMLMPYKKVVMA